MPEISSYSLETLDPSLPLTQIGKGVKLEIARLILQSVVSTDEKRLRLNTPLEEVCGYTLEQIRGAAYVVAQGIIRTDRTDRLMGDESIRKKSNTAQAWFALHQVSGQLQGSTIPLGVRLSASELHSEVFLKGLPKAQRVECAFPLSDYLSETMRFDWGVKDFRKYPSITVNLGGERIIDEDDYRILIRGARWLFANMLSWREPGFIMPEQLGDLALPPAKS